MHDVDVAPLPADRIAALLSETERARWEESVRRSRAALAGRTVWNVNTTSRGGGVAEMLWSLLAYARGVGIDTRWLVMDGDEPFFRVTKRIHNLLHGHPGDGQGLTDADRAAYEAVSARNAEALVAVTRPGDVVLLHDPQTAGLAPLLPTDRLVVWRSHIGVDAHNDLAREGWDFVRGYFESAHRYVFTRREYAPPGLDGDRIVVIPPSIDAFSPKNQDLDEPTVHAVLAAAGLVDAGGPLPGRPEFLRTDGTVGVVMRQAELSGPPPALGTPLVLQVSRWDRLKDPVGVVRGFAEHVAPAVPEAHLVYAGPAAAAVADDPEGAETLAETRAVWAALPDDLRARVHLATLPMDDASENAAIVNALQRHAAVVVQKSLAEGFGLTVAEAMWKARPVVASRVGGIQDQVEDGVSGVLLDDARDLRAYGDAVTALLRDPDRAARMGAAARERVRTRFLSSRHLMQYEALLVAMLTPSAATPA